MAGAKEAFFREFLTLRHGVPSHDTFSRVFRLIDPVKFHACFLVFMRKFSETIQGVIAIDGKTLRRSFDRASQKSALHLVSAWAADQRLVLGQFGLARNPRLEALITDELAEVEAKARDSGRPERLFKELRYQTLNSWSCERRVVAKAEHLPKGKNPRFTVTSLSSEAFEAKELYEKIYCARGDMENRIKECQLDLFADRTSAGSLRANQLRLWLASLAYVLMTALRRIALQGTELAHATAGTIRLKLLKLGALVTVSVRRVKIAIASACPLKGAFAGAHWRLCSVA